jgi:uncharacterized protein YbjT (DUF2867 family)
VVEGDALKPESVAAALRTGDTLVHLVGTAHPNPSKASQFRTVDLASIRASVAAGKEKGISHLVYVSVAQPAPVMKEYIRSRMDGERVIRESGLRATILRPWYVIGPGHWWPVTLLPLYGLALLVPSAKETVKRLGLVSITQMVRALVSAVENPPQSDGLVVLGVPEIRKALITPQSTRTS